MKSSLVIFQKEVRVFFQSPLAYVLIGLFTLISGWLFFSLLAAYSDSMQALPAQYTGQVSFLNEVVLRFLANVNFLLLFFVPLITMGSFADEKKHNTIDLLQTAPLSDCSILMGKWLGSFFIIAVLLFSTLGHLIFVFFSGVQDWAHLMVCYFSLLLNGFCYAGIGILASSLTSNAMIAAVLSSVLILSTWFSSMGAGLTSNYFVAEFLRYLSVTSHFENMMRGVFSFTDLIYYVSVLTFLWIVSLKSLQSRHWT